MTEAKPESELLSIVHNGQTFREGDLVSFKPADHINTDWVTATLVRRDTTGSLGLQSDTPWDGKGYRPTVFALSLDGSLASGIEKIIRIVESCGDIYAKGTEVTNYDGRAYRAVPESSQVWDDLPPRDAQGIPFEFFRVDFDATRDSKPELVEGFVKAGTELKPEDIKVGMKLKIESTSAGDGYEELNSYTFTAHSETWGEDWVRVVTVNKSGETLGLSGWTIILLEDFAPDPPVQEEEPRAPEPDVEPDMKAVLEEMQQSIDTLLNLLRSGGGEL